MDVFKIVILGPPGSGKDTQGIEVGRGLGVQYISFRKCIVHHLNKKTELGVEFKKYYPKKPVPAEMMKKMFECIVDLKKGYLLNGYPSKEEEAISFINEFEPEFVVSLSIKPEDSKTRLLNRRIDLKTNKIYNLKFYQPPNDIEVKNLKRDSPTNIEKRISSYLSEDRRKCLQVLKSNCHFIEVDGTKNKESVTSEICQRIRKLHKEIILKRKRTKSLGEKKVVPKKKSRIQQQPKPKHVPVKNIIDKPKKKEEKEKKVIKKQKKVEKKASKQQQQPNSKNKKPVKSKKKEPLKRVTVSKKTDNRTENVRNVKSKNNTSASNIPKKREPALSGGGDSKKTKTTETKISKVIAPRSEKLPLKIIILGSPGSGKEVQGKKLAEYFGIPYFGFRDCLIHHLTNKTPYASEFQKYYPKKPIPGSLMNTMIEHYLKNNSEGDGGFVMKNYPQTKDQLVPFLEKYRPEICILLRIRSPEVSKERLRYRRIDPNTKRIYNLKTSPPTTSTITKNLRRMKKDSKPSSIEKKVEDYFSSQSSKKFEDEVKKCFITSGGLFSFVELDSTQLGVEDVFSKMVEECENYVKKKDVIKIVEDKKKKKEEEEEDFISDDDDDDDNGSSFMKLVVENRGEGEEIEGEDENNNNNNNNVIKEPIPSKPVKKKKKKVIKKAKNNNISSPMKKKKKKKKKKKVTKEEEEEEEVIIKTKDFEKEDKISFYTDPTTPEKPTKSYMSPTLSATQKMKKRIFLSKSQSSSPRKKKITQPITITTPSPKKKKKTTTTTPKKTCEMKKKLEERKRQKLRYEERKRVENEERVHRLRRLQIIESKKRKRRQVKMRKKQEVDHQHFRDSKLFFFGDHPNNDNMNNNNDSFLSNISSIHPLSSSSNYSYSSINDEMISLGRPEIMKNQEQQQQQPQQQQRKKKLRIVVFGDFSDLQMKRVSETYHVKMISFQNLVFDHLLHNTLLGDQFRKINDDNNNISSSQQQEQQQLIIHNMIRQKMMSDDDDDEGYILKGFPYDEDHINLFFEEFDPNIFIFSRIVSSESVSKQQQNFFKRLIYKKIDVIGSNNLMLKNNNKFEKLIMERVLERSKDEMKCMIEVDGSEKMEDIFGKIRGSIEMMNEYYYYNNSSEDDNDDDAKKQIELINRKIYENMVVQNIIRMKRRDQRVDLRFSQEEQHNNNNNSIRLLMSELMIQKVQSWHEQNHHLLAQQRKKKVEVKIFGVDENSFETFFKISVREMLVMKKEDKNNEFFSKKIHLYFDNKCDFCSYFSDPSEFVIRSVIDSDRIMRYEEQEEEEEGEVGERVLFRIKEDEIFEVKYEEPCLELTFSVCL